MAFALNAVFIGSVLFIVIGFFVNTKHNATSPLVAHTKTVETLTTEIKKLQKSLNELENTEPNEAITAKTEKLVSLTEELAKIELWLKDSGDVEEFYRELQGHFDSQMARVNEHSNNIALNLALVAIVITALTIGLSLNLTLKDNEFQRELEKAEREIEDKEKETKQTLNGVQADLDKTKGDLIKANEQIGAMLQTISDQEGSCVYLWQTGHFSDNTLYEQAVNYYRQAINTLGDNPYPEAQINLSKILTSSIEVRRRVAMRDSYREIISLLRTAFAGYMYWQDFSHQKGMPSVASLFIQVLEEVSRLHRLNVFNDGDTFIADLSYFIAQESLMEKALIGRYGVHEDHDTHHETVHLHRQVRGSSYPLTTCSFFFRPIFLVAFISAYFEKTLMKIV